MEVDVWALLQQDALKIKTRIGKGIATAVSSAFSHFTEHVQRSEFLFVQPEHNLMFL